MRSLPFSLALTLAIGTVHAADDPAAIVARLGSRGFADRETAAKVLRQLGPKALPAVKAGCESADAEIARRCKLLREQLRADWRAAYKFDASSPHPTWERFVALVGDSPAARTLFAEMISNATNFARIDDAVDDPARALAHYTDMVADITRSRNELLKVTFHVPVWPGESPAELATLLFLGACFSGDAWPTRTDSNANHLPVHVAGKPLRSPAAEPIQKLFVAWLEKRADEGLIRIALDTVFCHGIWSGLPFARRIAGGAELSPVTRAAALPVIGRLGTAADAEACQSLLDSDLPFATFDTNGYLSSGTKVRTRTVQVRDIAAAVALTLRGVDPRTCGFTAADEPTWREYLIARYDSFTIQQMTERAPGTSKDVRKEILLWPPAHGFETAADRDAAHTRAREVLARPVK